jgi:hypothetical protein
MCADCITWMNYQTTENMATEVLNSIQLVVQEQNVKTLLIEKVLVSAQLLTRVLAINRLQHT